MEELSSEITFYSNKSGICVVIGDIALVSANVKCLGEICIVIGM